MEHGMEAPAPDRLTGDGPTQAEIFRTFRTLIRHFVGGYGRAGADPQEQVSRWLRAARAKGIRITAATERRIRARADREQAAVDRLYRRVVTGHGL